MRGLRGPDVKINMSENAKIKLAGQNQRRIKMGWDGIYDYMLPRKNGKVDRKEYLDKTFNKMRAGR